MQPFARLLQHPIAALIWECWRLSRRWYLWVLPALFGIDYFFMGQADSVVLRSGGRIAYADIYPQLAIPAFIINFSLASLATLLVVSMGSKAGFPLAFAFRLPVKTPLLVAVPMTMLALQCASLYVLPMLLCRVLFDVPFPLLPAAALLMTLVSILLTCSWSTTTTRARTAAVLLGVIVSVELFALLDPFNIPAMYGHDGPPRFSTGIIALGAGQYAFLTLLCLALLWLGVSAIRKERRGETALAGWYGARPAEQPAASSTLSTLLNRSADMLNVPCPTRAPWRAELWLELKRHGMPMLLLSVMVALVTPLLFALGMQPSARTAWMDYLLPLIVFLGAIGIAIFNRRMSTAGYMSVFEGTRGMSTAALAVLQILSVGVAMLGGILLVCFFVYWAPRWTGAEPGLLALRIGTLLEATRTASGWMTLAETLTALVIYLSTIALFACVHALSVIWGRAVPYIAGVVAIYALAFAFSVEGDQATFENIKRHMWGFAAFVLLLTIAISGRALYLRILSPRGGLAMLACWALFVVCALAGRSTELADQAPELQAFNMALLMLPLMLFALLFWSYDRLRHR